MQWLQKCTIRARLVALAVLAAAMTLTVGGFGLTRVAELNGLLANLYDNNLVPVADVANANMQAIYHNRGLFDYVVERDPAYGAIRTRPRPAGATGSTDGMRS